MSPQDIERYFSNPLILRHYGVRSADVAVSLAMKVSRYRPGQWRKAGVVPPDIQFKLWYATMGALQVDPELWPDIVAGIK